MNEHNQLNWIPSKWDLKNNNKRTLEWTLKTEITLEDQLDVLDRLNPKHQITIRKVMCSEGSYNYMIYRGRFYCLSKDGKWEWKYQLGASRNKILLERCKFDSFEDAATAFYLTCIRGDIK